MKMSHDRDRSTVSPNRRSAARLCALGKMPKFLLAGAILVASASLAAAQDKGTFKIVTQTPLSGPQSVNGEAIMLGARLAVADFSKQINDLGYKVALQPEDDQAVPNVGVANANRIINDPDVLAVVGHYNSGVTIPASEIYAKVTLAMISPTATNPMVTDRPSTQTIASRVCGRDDVQGPAAANYAIDALHAKKFYIINDKTAYGSGLAMAFEAAARAKGAMVVLSTGVDAAETDFSSILNRAKIERPDLIFYGGNYSQGGLFIKQIRQNGVASPILGGDGLDSSDLQNLAGAENMKNVFFITTAVPLSKLPTAGPFLAAYKASFGKDPEGVSAYGYDAAHAVLEALANAIKADKGAKPTREQLAEEVRKVDLEGLTGRIAFNKHGDVISGKYVVVKAGDSADKNQVADVVEVNAPNSQ
jgi:branched-chain amino acid transport system substrate-binding protein